MAYRFPFMAPTVSPIRVTLRALRQEADLTQVELAERARVRQATISSLEQGNVTRLDLPVIEKLCITLGEALGKKPGDLIARLLVYEPDKPKGKGKR